MIEMTVQISEQLAARIGASGLWLPTVFELGLTTFKTKAAVTAMELVSYLETNPPPESVLKYHASERSHLRLQRLLALSEANLLSEKEEQELDELEKIEHLVVMLKAQAAKIMKRGQIINVA